MSKLIFETAYSTVKIQARNSVIHKNKLSWNTVFMRINVYCKNCADKDCKYIFKLKDNLLESKEHFLSIECKKEDLTSPMIF